MKTERNNKSRYYEVLLELKKGYETGDFSELFPHLAEDCVLESQWVLTPHKGYDDIVDYLQGKGAALLQSGAFPTCTIVQLVGSHHSMKVDSINVNGKMHGPANVGLMYKTGSLCLLMEQTLNGKTNGVLVDLKIDKEGMVKRIDLCMPGLFRFKHYNVQH